MRRLLLPLLRSPLAAGFAFAVIGLGLCVRAQDLSGAAGYTVRGTVLNDATGQPVARAEVILDNDQAQLTAGDGSFAFDHVPGGAGIVSIRKPGYLGFGRPLPGAVHNFSAGSEAGRLGPPRRILIGPDMPSLTFRLTPLASISGHLTLSTADPADHIRVTLLRRTLQNGHPRWGLATLTETRSDGSFHVTGLLPGQYLVLTSASIDGPNDPENSGVPVWGFPALYYPGVTDAGSAGVLVLKAGQQAQADMTLVRQRFFPVTIAVRGMPNTPTSFQIDDASGRSTGLPVQFEMRTGIAHANVPNGSWSLIAHAFGETMRFGRVDFQVASVPVDLSLTVTSIPPLQVEINREFSSSSDGSQRSVPWGWSNLSLLPADDSAAGGIVRGFRSTGGGTHDALVIFQPGKFWVTTTNPGSTYVSSVTSGGTDLATTPLTVTPGSPTPPIEVTLRNDIGTIAGKIDSPAASAPGGAGEQPQIWIYAIPLFPTTNRLTETVQQDTGQFEMDNVAPGSYRVVACDQPQEIDYHSADGRAVWSGKGQVVTVDPNGTANVELNVVHGEPAP